MARGLKLTDTSVLLLAGGFAATLWLADQPPWRQYLTIAGYITAILIYWALFVRRRSCSVPNRSDGRPCAQPVRGVFSACYRPEHKRRKRLFGASYPPPARVSYRQTVQTVTRVRWYDQPTARVLELVIGVVTGVLALGETAANLAGRITG